MSRALRFSKAELRNALALVQSSDVAVKLTPDGSILLFPAKHIAGKVDLTDEEALDAELAALEAKYGDG